MPYSQKTHEHLAARLREWRKLYGLSLKELSAMTDISARTLEGIEQGRGFRYPNLITHAMRGITATPSLKDDENEVAAQLDKGTHPRRDE